jgi:hypothetical protein
MKAPILYSAIPARFSLNKATSPLEVNKNFLNTPKQKWRNSEVQNSNKKVVKKVNHAGLPFKFLHN